MKGNEDVDKTPKENTRKTMLETGIYEHIINCELKDQMYEVEGSDAACKIHPMDTAESPHLLATYAAKAIRQRLEEIEDQNDRVSLINGILAEAGILEELQIADSKNLLAEVMTRQQALLQEQSHTQTIRPVSGFRVSNLFTGGNSSLSLVEEIRREIASADEICFIVSFLRLTGVRIMLDELRKFCQKDGSRLRIITTTYCAVTEAKAIEHIHQNVRQYQT